MIILVVHVLLFIFGIMSSVCFIRYIRNPQPFFKGGLDLKNNSNDRLLIATMILWFIIVVIVLLFM